MSAKEVYTVTIEPAGIEMQVEEDETVLDAAFRQGIALMHGCKEGQCGSCKAILVQGDAHEDIELLKFSSFALPDAERENDHILLCRTQLFADISIELLNVDEELLSASVPVSSHAATLVGMRALTHDIRLIEIELDEPLAFKAGQYVDITLPGTGIRRAFSMANPPSRDRDDGRRLDFIIKKYPDGKFSSMLDQGLGVGDPLEVKGAYGSCFRRASRTGALVLVGGGSGMSPLWSILHDQLATGEGRPILFFYGARTSRDLFYVEELAALAAEHPELEFVPALSEPDADVDWRGETGFIHEVLARRLGQARPPPDSDAYACGPPPMIDAVLPVLQMNGIESDHVHSDRFTPSVSEA